MLTRVQQNANEQARPRARCDSQFCDVSQGRVFDEFMKSSSQTKQPPAQVSDDEIVANVIAVPQIKKRRRGIQFSQENFRNLRSLEIEEI